MTEMETVANDGPLEGSDAADSLTCAVPSCINSVPRSERPCNCHQSSISDQPSCQCLPSVPAKFFVFPTEEEDRTRWIRLIHREELLLTGQFDPEKMRICCRHFPDAMPTETDPDPVLNLSPEAEDCDVEMDASPLPTVNNTDSEDSYCAEEADMNLMIDDFQPGLAEITIETTNSDPPEEDDQNLNGDDLDEAPSPTETKTEESPSPEPVPLPQKGRKPLKDETSDETDLREKEPANSLPDESVAGVQRQRRSSAKKDFSKYKKDSSESEGEEEEEEEEEEEPEEGEEEEDEDSDEDSEEETRIYCKCGEANTDDMIGCDGQNCKHEWFHFKCVGIDPKKVPQGKWYCESCWAQKVKLAKEKKRAMKRKCKIQRAVKEIKALKISIEAASEAYRISKEVLSKHLSLESPLTKQEESRLVEMAINMSKRGNWANVQDSVLNSVKLLLDVEEKMGVKRQHDFVGNLPAQEWWIAFCNRHPKMRRLRKQHEPPKEILNSSDQNIVKKPSNGKNPPTSTDIIKPKSLKGKPSLKQVNHSSDDTIKEQQGTADSKGSEINALECLEAIMLRKQQHIFQKRFKSGDESENDLVYSAWRALRCLYNNSAENKQDGPNHHGVPPYEGDIPPWSPCLEGPFYVPDESSRTSLSLLIGNPGIRTKKKLQSRIQTMKVKQREHYLEPWRFRLHNRKAIVRPWKFQVIKRNRRKCFITRQLDSKH